MEFNKDIIDKIKRELAQPLPGEDAQYRMAPSYRPRLTREQIQSHNPRVGGVMVLLYEKQGLINLVFTQRKEYKGVHSGQMSFPGGKKEPGDKDITETALREAKEEVGVEPSDIEIVGNLSELYIPPSNFLVYPVVGFIENVKPFIPQQSEVEKIVEIPLGFLLDQNNINFNTEVKLFNDAVVHVPAYTHNGHIIWGATAIMVSEFTYIVEKAIRQ